MHSTFEQLGSYRCLSLLSRYLFGTLGPHGQRHCEVSTSDRNLKNSIMPLCAGVVLSGCKPLKQHERKLLGGASQDGKLQNQSTIRRGALWDRTQNHMSLRGLLAGSLVRASGQRHIPERSQREAPLTGSKCDLLALCLQFKLTILFRWPATC